VDGCGVRRVNPDTGAVSTVDGTIWYQWSTIAGHWLYGVDLYGTIWRYDLAGGGARTRLATPGKQPGALAADDTYVWAAFLQGGGMYQISIATGAVTTTAATLAGQSPPTMLSVGGYLYLAQAAA